MTNREIVPSGQLLDTIFMVDKPSKESYELTEILVALGLNPTMRSFAVLALDLSHLASKNPPWTKKYVHSVYKGYMEPSPEFASAIAKLAQTTDGVPIGVAGTSYIRVLADARKIPEGSLIPQGAIVIKCARPGCPVWFVRIHPRQKYHDRACRG